MSKYQDALESTKCVVKLYQRLCDLEKSGMQQSPMYQDSYLLLDHMISLEKERYEDAFHSYSMEDFNFKIEHRKGFHFHDMSINNLVAMRFLNHCDCEVLYTLFGYVSDSKVIRLQEM